MQNDLHWYSIIKGLYGIKKAEAKAFGVIVMSSVYY